MICQQCGFNYRIDGVCPAEGETCNFCKKRNHFEKVCRKKKHESKRVRYDQPEIRVQQLTYDSSEDECAWVVDSRSTKGQTKKNHL